MNLIKCEPQPQHSHNFWWWYGEELMTDDGLKSHLFHDVHGNYLSNVPDECEVVEPVLIDGIWYWQTQESNNDIDMSWMNELPRHTERIRCPECGYEQDAEVLHSKPFAMFVHDCVNCKYTILESEWDRVEDLTDKAEVTA